MSSRVLDPESLERRSGTVRRRCRAAPVRSAGAALRSGDAPRPGTAPPDVGKYTSVGRSSRQCSSSSCARGPGAEARGAARGAPRRLRVTLTRRSSCQPKGCLKSSVEGGKNLPLNATMARNSMSRATDLFWVRKEKQLAVLRRFLSSTVRLDEREARFFVSPGEKKGIHSKSLKSKSKDLADHHVLRSGFNSRPPDFFRPGGVVIV